MQVKMFLILFFLVLQTGCIATSKITSLGKKHESASDYTEAYLEDRDLYLSYNVTNKSFDSEKRNIHLSINNTKKLDVERIDEIPLYIKNNNIKVINVSYGMTDPLLNKSVNCPAIINYYSYGEASKLVYNCLNQNYQIVPLPSPTSKGEYREFWAYPIIAIGIAPAIVFDIITFPYFAPKALAGGMTR